MIQERKARDWVQAAKRENHILDRIYDEVHHELNPSDDDCPECGGEGYIANCIDGLCFDAESGCEDCMRRCVECARFEIRVRKAVRLEVLRLMDVDVAIAFARRTNRWSDKITRTAVLANLHAARAAASTDFSPEEREASAAWVEGLI